MATITKELAIKIAKKLGAEIQNIGGAHDLAKVYYKGKLIAHFGIRRGSVLVQRELDKSTSLLRDCLASRRAAHLAQQVGKEVFLRHKKALNCPCS